jgi:hypothetical protein
MCAFMADNDRKSSDDLIREAKSGLGGAGQEFDSGDSAPATHPELTPPVEAQPLEYRSQQHEPVPGSDVSTSTQNENPIDLRPRRTTWIRGSLVRLIVAALAFGGWFVFTSLDDAGRDDSGAIVDAGDLDVMSLQVGDCFDDPENLEEAVFDVAAVPCTGPHDNEVFSVQSLGASFGDTYPGEDALSDYTYEVCSGTTFDSYVGSSYVDSSLEVFTFTPTQESWDDGDRGFVCALYRLDFGKLTGTVRDSGL